MDQHHRKRSVSLKYPYIVFRKIIIQHIVDRRSVLGYLKYEVSRTLNTKLLLRKESCAPF